MIAAPKTAPSPLAAAVAAAMEATGGNRAKAIAALETRVRQDRKLRDELLDPLIRKACEDAIGLSIRRERGRIWRAPAADLAAQRERVVALATGTLLMFRLPTPGNRPLGESNRAQVLEAVSRYEGLSSDAGAKARWLQLVGQHLPDDKTVQEVMNADRLDELYREAHRAA